MYEWIGGDAAAPTAWSNLKNWLVGINNPNVLPGANDDLVFALKAGHDLEDSVVDAGFTPVKVKSISIQNSYTKTLTLDKDLAVASAMTVDFGGTGKILGQADLTIGEGDPNNPASFTWKAGDIGGKRQVETHLFLTPSTTATINGNNDQTANGRILNVQGNATLTIAKTGGDLFVNNYNDSPDTPAWIDVQAGGTLKLTKESALDGSGKLYLAGELIAELPTTTDVFDIETEVEDSGVVTVKKGILALQSISEHFFKTITVFGDGQLALYGDHYFDGDTTNPSVIQGTGTTWFYTNTTGHIDGEAVFNRIRQFGNSSIDGAGHLQINGKYEIDGGSKLKVATATVGAVGNNGPSLELGAAGMGNIILQTMVTNHGTVTWKEHNIEVTNNGGFDNQVGATFDIQTDDTIFKGGNAGDFTNRGTLKKTAGPGTAEIELDFIPAGGTVNKASGDIGYTEKVGLLEGTFLIAPGAGGIFHDGLDQSGGLVWVEGNLDVTNNYNFTGGLSVLDNAVFTVDALNASADAELLGYGTIVGDFNNNAVVYIGDTYDGYSQYSDYGSILIDGNFVQNGNGSLYFDLSDGYQDSIDVISTTGTEGNVTLGGTLELDAYFSYEPPEEIILINKGQPGAVSGAFSNFAPRTIQNVGGYDFRLIHDGGDGNDVALELGNYPPDAVDDPNYDAPHEYPTFHVDAWEGLLNNDSDFEGDPISIVAINGQAFTFGQPIAVGGGWLTVYADGSFDYDLPPGYVGLVQFTYTITDGNPENFDTATVTINVSNVPPSTSDWYYSTLHDQAFSESVETGLVPYNEDIDGDIITVSAINGVALVNGSISLTLEHGGSLTVYANGSFDYTPAAGFVGSESFSYTITDGYDTYTANVTIDVDNNAPSASDFADSTVINQMLSQTAEYGLIPGGEDIDGDTVTVTEVNGVALVNGSVTLTLGSGGTLTV